MITQNIDTCWIPSQQDKVKVTNFKKLPKLQFVLNFEEKTLHATHLKLLDKMCEYEMAPM